MKGQIKSTLPILFSFQIKSTVHEISQKTIGYKMIGIMILIISAGSINPHAILDSIYQLRPVQQANVIAFIFSAYLLLSAMFNQKVVISPQLLYIRQLPINYELLFWSHIASLSLLNIFFIGALIYALWVASSLFAFSWLEIAALLTSSILGLAMGQIHYTCARAKSRRNALFSLCGFYIFICGFWYAIAISDQWTIGPSNIMIFASSTAVLVCGYLITKQIMDRI